MEENRDLDRAFAPPSEPDRRFPLWAKLAIAAGGLILLVGIAATLMAKARVFSLGKDGQPGGEGDDRGIEYQLILDGSI